MARMYIDTRESSSLRMGAARTVSGMDTVYDVRLSATKSRPGRVLASFPTLDQAERYLEVAGDRRWGLVQMG